MAIVARRLVLTTLRSAEPPRGGALVPTLSVARGLDPLLGSHQTWCRRHSHRVPLLFHELEPAHLGLLRRHALLLLVLRRSCHEQIERWLLIEALLLMHLVELLLNVRLRR